MKNSIMYRSWFGLQHSLFPAGPHTFARLSRYHEYGAFLFSALQRDSVIWLYGAGGCGKSTLLHHCHNTLPGSFLLVASPLLTEKKGAQTLMGESANVSELAAYLLSKTPWPQHIILIIDNASELPPQMNPWLAELSAQIEQRQGKLALLLAGSKDKAPFPELDLKIHARLLLAPLNKQECAELLEQAAKDAGAPHPLFTRCAIDYLARASHGLPTPLMMLAENALHSAMLRHKKQVQRQDCRRGRFDLWRISPFSGLRPLIVMMMLAVSVVAGWQVAPRIINQAPFLTLWSPPKPVEAQDKTPALISAMDNETDGMQQYYAIWGYQAQNDEANCDAAARVSLRCLRGKASLIALSETKMPWLAPLTLGLRIGYVSIVRLGPHDMDLLSGGKTWTVTRDWFTQHWKGDYLQFQRLTPSGIDKVSAQSPTIDKDWLQKQLVSALNLSPDAKNSSSLINDIRRFQQQSGLDADGVAGEKTLLKLAQQLGSAPLLILETNKKNP